MRIAAPRQMWDGFKLRRSSLCDCLSLHVQIDSGVFVHSINTGVSKPIGNSGKIDSEFQKMNSYTVPYTMWMEALYFRRRVDLCCFLYVLCHNVSDSKPGKRCSQMIREQGNRLSQARPCSFTY